MNSLTLRFSDVLIKSYRIFISALTKIIAFSAFFFKNVEEFSSFIFNKFNDSLTLNLYKISLEDKSMKTLIELFSEIWMKNIILTKLSSFIISYRMIIFTVWLILLNCSSTKKWYAVVKCKAISRWMNVAFQNETTNLKSRSKIIVLSNSHSSFCKMFNHVNAYWNAFHIFLFARKLISSKNLFVIVNKTSYSCDKDNVMIKSMMIVWNDNVIFFIKFN
jgi:hypothetical protein